MQLNLNRSEFLFMIEAVRHYVKICAWVIPYLPDTQGSACNLYKKTLEDGIKDGGKLLERFDRGEI